MINDVLTLDDFLPKGTAQLPDAPHGALPSIYGLQRDALAAQVVALGAKPFRAKQLWQWLYLKGLGDFAAMHTIPKDLQQQLAAHYSIDKPTIALHQISSDGTQKWLLRLHDGYEVEMVYIPDTDRGTLCISSQVGCTLNCRFCHTGTQRWVRNLTAAEIVLQVLIARDALGDWQRPLGARRLTNIVLMGMGEPLYNYDNVAQALKIIMDCEGISLSRRKITLSTSGVVPMIAKVGTELGVGLAISLHAVNDATRTQIVPLNKKYPIADLLEACRQYPAASNARRITFEYVMLAGVNDSDDDAHALVALLQGIPAKVNLIPFNPWPNSTFVCSSNNRIHRFADILSNAGFSSPVRTPRGRDILAACGQLKSASEKLRIKTGNMVAEAAAG